MKLLLKKDDNVVCEVCEITTVEKNSDILFFFLNQHLRKADIELIEKELSLKTGKQCVALDSLFANKIMGV